MKRIWETIKLFWINLFVGMKTTEDATLHQSGISLDNDSEVNQHVADHSVAKALLRGELTQEVKELRYRTYAVARESAHYNYFSPTLAQKKGVNDYKFAEDSVLIDDIRDIITIQDNKRQVETVSDAMDRINDGYDFDDKMIFTESPREYRIKCNRGNDVPRFKIEYFITKIVVKQGDDKYSAVLDLYVSKYPNPSDILSKPFVREIENAINNDSRFDMFDSISSIEFDTYKAYHVDDMLHFQFGDIQVSSITEYMGSYIIRLVTNIIDGGTDKAEQFYSETMAKRYENKEEKGLTIMFDPDAQFKTYVCADCGKTVTYDARALDKMNPTNDFSDGKVTEYLDYEMTEHEFGRMLCKDCAKKAQRELYQKALDNNNWKLLASK